MNISEKANASCCTVLWDKVMSQASKKHVIPLALAAFGGAICAISAAYIPLFTENFSDILTEAAKNYVSSFGFDITLGSFMSALSGVCSDELYAAFFLLISPAIIFGDKLVFSASALQAFCSSVCVIFVLRADIGTYQTVAAVASSLISIAFFGYSAHIALLFSDGVREAGYRAKASEIFAYFIKILSALGFLILVEILILLPSAFI